MPALAQSFDEDLQNHAANDDDINGGSETRTKYSYDNAGNTLSDGTRTFTYNSAGRMKSATAAGLTTTYTYNALGQRVLKSNSLATTLFMYDEAGHLMGEYDGAGNLIEEIAWLGDIPVASVRPGQGGGVGVFYINTDHLNAPVSLSRTNDNVIVWQSSSDPYGAGFVLYDPDGNGSNVTFNLRSPGQYYDAETGLNYNYMRDYDPAVGRYVESDPIGLKGGINTYLYGYANPITNVDPLGLIPPSPVVALEEAIATGNIQAIETLTEAGEISEADSQRAIAEIALRNNSTGNIKQLADLFNRNRQAIEDAIHQCKTHLPRSSPIRNPDVVVNKTTGEVYPKLPNGRLGDSIGNILDYLHPK